MADKIRRLLRLETLLSLAALTVLAWKVVQQIRAAPVAVSESHVRLTVDCSLDGGKTWVAVPDFSWCIGGRARERIIEGGR